MMRSLWTAASGMKAQQISLDTISNNLANINTTGYKKETTTFQSLLYQTVQERIYRKKTGSIVNLQRYTGFGRI